MNDSETDVTPAERPLLGPVVRRRRRSSAPDPVLVEAVEAARQGILEVADAASVGTEHRVRVEEDRLLTHLFECLLPGYRGWFWYSTIARAPRSKAVTVCETGLLPGDDALLTPAWVPWADRVRPEELHEDDAPEDGEDGAAESDDAEGAAPDAGDTAVDVADTAADAEDDASADASETSVEAGDEEPAGRGSGGPADAANDAPAAPDAAEDPRTA
ncbi:DUF3027 domain-containing protein [Rothia sp. AR01]|uniref:DUF3027 domain-containing protein n=1 Tax=Rothia santali TaxID=2949643 RepID=A0A9X2HFL5_9MICC|nr:DUF3027 domain-containing protein [Rothia santali]MCP3426409.1 DUF3027 domain-containing protein [Rothia santali]